MIILTDIALLVVAFLHFIFLFLEMFLWTRPFGQRTFGLTPEFAVASKTLAANQGLYNGFLAAGLIWGLFLGTGGFGVRIFFLACALVAGLYGGLSSSRKILWAQAMPAIITLGLVLISG